MNILLGQSNRYSLLDDSNTVASPAAYVEAGDAYRDGRDWQLARTNYRAALELDPCLTPIWVQLGHANKELGRYEESEDCYLAALNLCPDSSDTYLNLGHLLKLRGDIKGSFFSYLISLSLPFCSKETEHEFRHAWNVCLRDRERIIPMDSKWKDSAARKLLESHPLIRNISGEDDSIVASPLFDVRLLEGDSISASARKFNMNDLFLISQAGGTSFRIVMKNIAPQTAFFDTWLLLHSGQNCLVTVVPNAQADKHDRYHFRSNGAYWVRLPAYLSIEPELWFELSITSANRSSSNFFEPIAYFFEARDTMQNLNVHVQRLSEGRMPHLREHLLSAQYRFFARYFDKFNI